ncbi:hypothetical protein EXU57_04820 [Segetibacter sp. 3557_3]|uniref:hypothetical protein n=1 Tax=Segetibacter sp. 3557_3 TaxID=2547429 RepID=UPI0010591B98|nr:hypothetical protein [Segetibacter sp. 3557_3]TDH27798.1 hypothetical protein EXU57_04820 [Segetibacter sp. 3557_3]
MKKLLSTALIALFVISSSFAGTTTNVNRKVTQSFEWDFKGVQDVQWTTTDAYAIASFVQNNKGTKAYYSHDGELIGCASAVNLEELSSAAKRSFAKKYSNYKITEAIKFEKTEGSAYFISAEKDSEKLILQVDNGHVSVYKKLS